MQLIHVHVGNIHYVLQQGKKHHEYAISVGWNVHHNSLCVSL